MHNDEVIWQVLGKTFCSYNVKIEDNSFCRNKYNVTGLCNKVSCPLANGNYATVIEEEGQCFLYLKTIERVHLPNKMWEKVQLSNSYTEALGQVTQHMTNIYKDHEINRCKLRLTRLRQTLVQMRKMQLTPQTTVVPVKQKTERREAVREKKALTAAKLEVSIEKELLNRLQQGVYGDVYNYDRETSAKVLEETEGVDTDRQVVQDLEFIEDNDDDLLNELEEYEQRLLTSGTADDVNDVENLLKFGADSEESHALQSLPSKKRAQLMQSKKFDEAISLKRQRKTISRSARVEVEYEEPQVMRELLA